MKIYQEQSLRAFKGWGPAIKTIDRIIEEKMEYEFEDLIEELYPDGIEETKLNDILAYNSDWVFEQLGIEKEE